MSGKLKIDVVGRTPICWEPKDKAAAIERLQNDIGRTIEGNGLTGAIRVIDVGVEAAGDAWRGRIDVATCEMSPEVVGAVVTLAGVKCGVGMNTDTYAGLFVVRDVASV